MSIDRIVHSIERWILSLQGGHFVFWLRTENDCKLESANGAARQGAWSLYDNSIEAVRI